MTTMAIVLMSVFGLGSTTECMLNKLHIEMNVDESSYMEQRCQEHRRGGWIGRWEDYLYRSVVRGANHVSVPDADISDDCKGEENGNNNPPILSRTTRNLELTQDVEEFRDEDDDDDSSDDIVLDPRRLQRRKESVFDYGARGSS